MRNGVRLLVALYGARLLVVIAVPPLNKMCVLAYRSAPSAESSVSKLATYYAALRPVRAPGL